MRTMLTGMLTWVLGPALALAGVVAPGAADAADGARKLVLVTLDGVRWHEMFEGPDRTIVADKRYVDPDIRHDVIAPAFVDVPDPAAALMPFVQTVIARQGVLWGDPRKGQCAEVSNGWAVSYPGYNEILTGRPDPAISGNEPLANPNMTFMERLNRNPAYTGQIGVAGNWDLFAKIFNTPRSHLAVNAGLDGHYPSEVRVEREAFRLIAAHTRVIYVALGDTDEYAHAGNYAMVLAALERADDMVRRIWETMQADPFYRGQTTLLITTDHGRGDSADEAWREHGSLAYYRKYPDDGPAYRTTGVIGSDKVWFAALGVAVARDRPAPSACQHSAQIAASALAALGEDWHHFAPEAAPPFWFIRP